MKLIVCPGLHARHCFETFRPSHVLGLLSPGQDEMDLGGAPPKRLELRFNDIAEPHFGLVAPDETAMDAILALAASWTGEAPMLIYCFAGISRSTAAAFAIACQARASVGEQDIANVLRRLSPSATPNPLMVALADAILNRQGRMKAAIFAIGRGLGLFQDRCFTLDLDALT